MTDVEEVSDRLERIERSLDQRPGDAQTELEAVLPAIGETITTRQVGAQQLVRNEDFVGAAHLLVENGLLLQHAASLLLELRDQIRRRR